MTTRQTALLLLAGCALVAAGAGVAAGTGAGLAVAGLLLIGWTLVVAYGSAAEASPSATADTPAGPSRVDRGDVVARRGIVPGHARDMPDADADELAV